MQAILSTKKLKINQRDLLLNAGFRLVDYDAITIDYLDVVLPETIENAIFTSQHGVRSILDKSPKISNCYCVGEKTGALLAKNGYKVAKIGKNAQELAAFLVNNCKNDSFYYFCGSERRDELPDMLNASKMSLNEVKTYKTGLHLKKFDQNWSAILFFSPSGVTSYFRANPLSEATKKQHEAICICIGNTTASEVKKYGLRTITANATSVESVIAMAVKILSH